MLGKRRVHMKGRVIVWRGQCQGKGEHGGRGNMGGCQRLYLMRQGAGKEVRKSGCYVYET